MEDCTVSDSPEGDGELPGADHTPVRDSSGVFDVMESPQTDEAKEDTGKAEKYKSAGLYSAGPAMRELKVHLCTSFPLKKLFEPLMVVYERVSYFLNCFLIYSQHEVPPSEPQQ